MTLKELVMNTDYKDVEPWAKLVFEVLEDGWSAYRRVMCKKVFDTLRHMEAAPNVDMRLWIKDYNINGYFDEETLKKNPEYEPYAYAVECEPWSDWLGMELNEETLTNLSAGEIIGNCIFEMTWWGWTEEDIKKNLEESFKKHEEEIQKEKNGKVPDEE